MCSEAIVDNGLIVVVVIVGLYTGLLLYLNAKVGAGQETPTNVQPKETAEAKDLLKPVVSILGLLFIGVPLFFVLILVVIVILTKIGVIDPDSIWPR